MFIPKIMDRGFLSLDKDPTAKCMRNRARRQRIDHNDIIACCVEGRLHDADRAGATGDEDGTNCLRGHAVSLAGAPETANLRSVR